MVENRTILFYDGVCNVCNSTVQFIIRHEKIKEIHFASLQSDFAQKFLAERGIRSLDLNSMIFYERGQISKKSTGVLHLSKYLKAPWSWGRIFLILPEWIRDKLYDIFAKYRYKFFGKSDSCMLPSAAIKARFIEI